MLKIIEEKSRVTGLNKVFLQKIRRAAEYSKEVEVGYPGGNGTAKVYYIKKYDFWGCFDEAGDNRYWNAFGVGKPKETSNNSIVCELNFPFSGILRSIGGAFAEDEAGNIYLVSRGKIGGGRVGIGKNLFDDNYQGSKVAAEDGGMVSEVAPIAAMKSPRFIAQLAFYIREVERIKKLAASSKTGKNAGNAGNNYNPEFKGKRKRNRQGPSVQAECDHGLVVDALKNRLANDGLKIIANSKNMDLYVKNSKGKITWLFEVKTDVDTTDIYQGVGQLIVNSGIFAPDAKLVIVLPQSPSQRLRAAIGKAGIEVVTYSWVKNTPEFKF